MGTKVNPGDYDCYEKAEPDEPMFILLARDPWAAGTVRHWARIQIVTDEQPQSKIDEAMACADAMEKWREEQKDGWNPRIGTRRWVDGVDGVDGVVERWGGKEWVEEQKDG